MNCSADRIMYKYVCKIQKKTNDGMKSEYQIDRKAKKRMKPIATLPLRVRNLGVKERRPYYLWGWVQYAKQATRRWLALHPTDG
jgi:hypothetical protein